jgi:peroxiredoxin
MLCPHCREVLPQRSRYCPKCGFLSTAVEQAPVKKSAPAYTSARPQAIPIPIPRASVAAPQSMAQAITHQQQSFGIPPVQHQRNCPKCGASIDHELGRCSGCGLLYGVKHRAMQQQTPPATAPARPALPPRTQSFVGQQPLGAQAMRPQYGNTMPGVPVPSVPSFGRSPTNYGSASLPPQGGMLMPIPSVAPAAAGAASASIPMAPRPYQYQTAPSAPAARGIPASGNRGLTRVVSTIVIIVVCLLIGGGIYYFFNRQGTSPTPDNAVSTPTLTMQNHPITSTTETGATIKWTTDKPSTSLVEITDASGAVIKKIPEETLASSHSITISDLSPSTTYHYKVVSTYTTGTPTTSEGTLTTTAAIITDKTAPTISAVNVNVTESGAIITWITNEPATSQIKYGKTETYDSTTPLDNNLTTTHNVTLTQLDSATTYNFTILSQDAVGNQATSATNQTFKTLTPIPVGLQVGNRAPDFTLQNLDGQNVTLSSFRGKIVMINFWATWCGPCKDELPYIQAVSTEWSSKGVVVLAVAVKTNEQFDTVQQFISQNSYTFPVLFDSQGVADNLYGASTLPTTFFIDAEGIIKKSPQIGSFENKAAIENILNSLQ